MSMHWKLRVRRYIWFHSLSRIWLLFIVLWRKLSNDLFKCNCNSNFIIRSILALHPSAWTIQTLTSCFLVCAPRTRLNLNKTFICEKWSVYRKHANVSSENMHFHYTFWLVIFEMKTFSHILWTYLHRNWCNSLWRFSKLSTNEANEENEKTNILLYE